MGKLLILLGFSASVWAGDLAKARLLYERAEFAAAARVLEDVSGPKTAESNALAGRCAYMLGNFEAAADFFERAARAEPTVASHQHSLGRAQGRRAEHANPVTAPVYAVKARQAFEKAVELDTRDRAAFSDLLSYYLEAPGFLGGGMDKASGLAEKIRTSDPAGYHHALARIALERQEFDAAASQLQRSVDLDAKRPDAWLDLARVSARLGKYPESDRAFERASSLEPSNPEIVFARAQSYVQSQRNVDQAKQLLQRYLEMPLTPENPSREEAVKLLKQVSGG